MAVTTLRIKVGDNWYNVEVGELTQSPVQVTVEGETFLVEVEGLPDQPPARPRRGSTQSAGVVAPQTPRGSKGDTPDNIITSPLSGKVISILVRPGDKITAGQELCVVEAMKMEQSIRASRNGIIKDILVQPMDAVRTDDPLMELE